MDRRGGRVRNVLTRFSDRVDNYVRYRPGYPDGLLELLRAECRLSPDETVVDIGCGTGISSRIFLDNGNRVIGVEPNAAMRSAAERELSLYPWFRTVDGTAERTGLDDNIADVVTAMQALHWFDKRAAGAEFRRILRPGGRIIVVWNERQLDTTPFLAEYEMLLRRFGTDYDTVRHDRTTDEEFVELFEGEYERARFDNEQHLDLEGLVGRTASSSYMPNEDMPEFAELRKELERLFANHERNGRIALLYDTNVFYSC